MTAEGLNLSMACAHGDGVSISKWGEVGLHSGGIYTVPRHQALPR